MGCSHSNANEVVVDPTTQCPSGYGKVSMDIVFTDIIVDETSKSVPLVDEEVEKYEKEVIVTALEAEDEPTPIEQSVEVVVKEPETIEEPVVVEVVVMEPETIEEPVVVEVGVMKKPTLKENEAPIEFMTEEKVQLHKEESLMLEKFVLTSTSAPTWTFAAEKVTFTVGVAFFNVFGFNLDGEEVYLTKRYSEFKVLHTEMAKLMPKEELINLPSSSFLQGRNDKALLQKREDAFVEMLNTIAQHPEGSQSTAFATFLA